jgi:predicted transcriptional regulator
MKVLSIKQPFAELIIFGRKSIEIRSWNTQFRGDFLVHASKKLDKEAMQRSGFEELPTGAIIGKVTLIDVKHYNTPEEFRNDQNEHLALSDYEKYGFILENPLEIDNVEINGKLNFWDYDF